MSFIKNPEDIILTPWEQALEDARSTSLGEDPYDFTSMAKEAVIENRTYITIPVSRATL